MTRSLWGWGTVEQAEDLGAARSGAAAFFGPLEVEVAAPPRVPPARVAVPGRLTGFASASEQERAAPAMGKSYLDRVRGFRGDFASGGWIATQAGGRFATLYTHIDDLVEALRLVTPRGVLETSRVPASGAGPDPNRLGALTLPARLLPRAAQAGPDVRIGRWPA